MADLPLNSLFYQKKVEFERKTKEAFQVDISQDQAKIYLIHAVLSNIILEPIFNNLDRIFNDATRIFTSLANTFFSIKCFNRMSVLRKEHVNNQEIFGLLFTPFIIYFIEKDNLDETEKAAWKELKSLISLFEMKMPVFKRYCSTQGIGSSFTIYKNQSIDYKDFLSKTLLENESLNENYLMSIFYFFTLFSQQFPETENKLVENFILKKLITEQNSSFKIFRLVLFFFSENLFTSSSSSILLSILSSRKDELLKEFKFPRKINRNKLILFNKSNDIKNVNY